jgi:MFS transporter, CP family, cyanate transporter
MREKNPGIPWTITLSAFLLVFAMWAPMFSVPPMEGLLRESLHISYAQLSLIYSTPLIMVAALAIPGGIISDRIGARKAAGIGAILIATGTALRGVAIDADQLLAFTFIYSVGWGLAYPNIPKLVAAWTPPDRSGSTAGLFNLGLPVGSALVTALTMSVVLPATGSFQGVFRIWSIVPIAAAILWWALVREPPRSETRLTSLTSVRASLARVAGNRTPWLIATLLFLSEFVNMTLFGWAPALFQFKGASPELAGLIASISLWVCIPAILLMPRLSDRMGRRKPFLWGTTIAMGMAALLGIFVRLDTAWVMMVITGISVPTRFITTLTLLVESMPARDMGIASGLVFLGYLGGVVGPLVGGHILDLTGSLDRSLLILLGVSLATLALIHRLPETGTRRKITTVQSLAT